MRSDRYTCEHCGAEAHEHPYDEEGWLIIEGIVSLTHKRDASGTAITGYLNKNEDVHFCSLECFGDYMKRIKRDGKLRPRK